MASTDLQDSDQDAKPKTSPAHKALEDQRRAAAGHSPGDQAQIDQLNAAYDAPSAKGKGADRGPDEHSKDKKSGAGSAGNMAKTAADVVGSGFNPEAIAAQSGVRRLVAPLVGGNKKRNGLIGGGVVAAILVTIGIIIGGNFILEHEAVHIQQVIAKEELKELDKFENDAAKKIENSVLNKSRNAEAAKQEEKADANDPLSEEMDKSAANTSGIATEIESQGLTPEISGGNITSIQNGNGQSVTPDSPDMQPIADDMVQSDVVETVTPVAVSQVGEPLDPFPESDPRSNSNNNQTLQSELTDDIKTGNGAPVAQADAKINEQDAKQTGNQQTDASNAAKVAAESQASGPLADAVNAADEAAAKGATSASALNTGISTFKSKLGSSVTDKFFVTGMITMLCNFEKAIQVASDKRLPELMTLLMRNGGLFFAFANHEQNSGGGPANVPPLNANQVKAVMLVVQNDPQLVAATTGDPDPVQNMPFTRSAEWNYDSGNPVTNTSNPHGANYTPAQDASSMPTRNAGQIIVDTIATFMKVTGFQFACSILTSTFGVIFQIAAGIGQIISSIGSLGASDAAILASNIALQQFLFSYVLPQALAYFTNLGVGLTSPVPFINNVGVGINLTAGTSARYEGAMPQTHDQTKTVLGQIAREQYDEEQHKPFMYRAFAMDNPYSLTYKLMNKLPTPFNSQGVFASVTNYFVSLPSSLGHVFSNITSAHAFAATNVQLNPNTAVVTQYYGTFNFDPQANEYYLRDPNKNPEANVTVDGQTATRIKMLGDPYTYQPSPQGDPDTNDLMHCYVDSPTLLTDTSTGNPNQHFCGALGTYDYEDDNPAKLGVPDDNTVTKIYCTYFGNPPNCENIVRPQVHDDVEHYSEYLGYKAAMEAWKGLTSAN